MNYKLQKVTVDLFSSSTQAIQAPSIIQQQPSIFQSINKLIEPKYQYSLMQPKSQVKYQIIHNKQNPHYQHKPTHFSKSKNNSITKSREINNQVISNIRKSLSNTKQKFYHRHNQHSNNQSKINLHREPLQCKEKFSNIVSKQYKSYQCRDSQFNRSQFPIGEGGGSLQAISIIQGLSLIGNSPLFNQQQQTLNKNYDSINEYATQKQSKNCIKQIYHKTHTNNHIEQSNKQKSHLQSLQNKQQQKTNIKKNKYFISLKKPNQVMKIEQQQQKRQRLQKFKKQLQIKAFMKDKQQQNHLSKRQFSYSNNAFKTKSISQSSVSKQRILNSKNLKRNHNKQNEQNQIKFLKQNQKYEKQRYYSVEPNISNSKNKSRYLNNFQQKKQYQLKYNYQTKPPETHSKSQQKNMRDIFQYNTLAGRQINSNFNKTQYIQFDNNQKKQSNLSKTTKNFNFNSRSKDNHQQGKIFNLNRDLKINQLFCLLFARFTTKNNSKSNKSLSNQNLNLNQNNLKRQIGVIQLSKNDMNQIILRLQAQAQIPSINQKYNKLTKFLGIMLRCFIEKSTSSYILLTRSIFLQEFQNQIQTQSNCSFRHNHSALVQQLSDFILNSSYSFNHLNSSSIDTKSLECSKKSTKTFQRAMLPKLETVISSQITNTQNIYVQSPKFCRLADIKIQESYESSPKTVKEQRSLKASKVVQKYQFSPPRKQAIQTRDSGIDMDYIKQKFSTSTNREDNHQKLNFSKTQISPLHLQYNNDLQKQNQRNRARFISNSNGRNDVFLKYIGKQSKKDSYKRLQNRIMKDSLIKEVYTKGILKNQNNRSYNQLVVLNQENDRRIEEENLTRKYLRHSNSLQSVHYRYTAKQQQQLNHRVSLKGQISFGDKRSDLCRLDNLSSKVDTYLALYKEKISRIGQSYESLRI